jgi:hypothetical protein
LVGRFIQSVKGKQQTYFTWMLIASQNKAALFGKLCGLSAGHLWKYLLKKLNNNNELLLTPKPLNIF